MLPMKEAVLAPGILLRAVQTTKFKNSLLSVTFLEPLTAEHAAQNALLPKVLRRGTQRYPDMTAFSAALDDLYGGGLEPILRKKGEVQCVGFWASFLDDAFVPGHTPLLEQAATLLGQVVLDPAGENGAFVPGYVDSEKENLVRKIRSQVNDKLQYALSRLRTEMCRGEAYGLDKLGSEEQVGAISGAGLYAHYRNLLETAPVCFYYCGSAEFERVEDAFRKAFAGLPQTKRQELPRTKVIDKPGSAVRRFQNRLDVTQGKLILGFRTGGGFRTMEEIAQGLLFNAVYGGTTNSKLFLNVREKHSLCYFANSSLAQNKGVMMVYSGVEFANFARAEEEILTQLAACQRGEITSDELETARRSVMGSLRTALDAQGRLEEYWINRYVSDTRFAPEELAQAVGEVRLDQVVQVANRIQLDSVYTLQGKEG